jgi:hypothetical protein
VDEEMTQDEIIRFAIQCRLVTTGNRDGLYMDALTEFANLVAQEVRDRIMFGSRDDWVLAEREACAKLCEEAGTVEQWDGLSEAADRIRARGEQA